MPCARGFREGGEVTLAIIAAVAVVVTVVVARFAWTQNQRANDLQAQLVNIETARRSEEVTLRDAAAVTVRLRTRGGYQELVFENAGPGIAQRVTFRPLQEIDELNLRELPIPQLRAPEARGVVSDVLFVPGAPLNGTLERTDGTGTHAVPILLRVP
jgi:hypothetical protein